jgi:hypothetical protein
VRLIKGVIYSETVERLVTMEMREKSERDRQSADDGNKR